MTFPRSFSFTCWDAANEEDYRRRYQQRHDDKSCDSKRRFVDALVPSEPITRHTAQPAAMFWWKLLLNVLVMVRLDVCSARGGCSAGRGSWHRRHCCGSAAVLHNSDRITELLHSHWSKVMCRYWACAVIISAQLHRCRTRIYKARVYIKWSTL